MPYATLLSFTRYVDRTGPAKASFVGGLRRQRESGGGFNPHGQLIKALKADIQFRTGGSHLEQVVETVNPRWQKLYGILADGAQRYLDSLGDPSKFWLVSTRDALGLLGQLPVKVAVHFGLCHDDGRREAVRLFFDEEPPSPSTVTATLHLLSAHMDQILPHAEPVLVDVRRGMSHRHAGPDSTAAVDSWLTGEAAGFTAMWSTPKPAARIAKAA